MKLAHTLLACCIAALPLTAPVVAHAAAPMVKTQAPGYYRIMLGDFEVTALSDGTAKLPVDKLLKNSDKKSIDKMLAYHYLSSPLETSFNAFLINTGSKLILFDTGAGAFFGPTLGKLVANLKAAGYQPEQVDEIYITHMHPDHIGGLVSNGRRVFPNAVVRAEKVEADYWLSPGNLAKAPADDKGFFKDAAAALKPYIDAGKFRPFDTRDNQATELEPGIRALITHGHTPGHCVYEIESKGQKLLVMGDLIHVAAVQFDHPRIAIDFDSNSKVAVAARIKEFNAVAKSGEIAAGAHLSFPGLGHMRKHGNGYEWIPLNYQSVP